MRARTARSAESGMIPDRNLLAWVHELAQDAVERNYGRSSLSTGCRDVNAAMGPVPAHVDILTATCPGILIHGLVIRSDGHRLHSRSLEKMGLTEGVPLLPGTFYVLDPWDEHWTTAPDDGWLIFTHDAFVPDGRTDAEIIEAMWEGLLESHQLSLATTE